LLLAILLFPVSVGLLLAWRLEGKRSFGVYGVGALALCVLFVALGFGASPSDSEPWEPRRFGLNESRVEGECLARVPAHLLSPSSMQFLGNPVGARAVWDPAENEWRWIMDVSAVNAFNVRMEQRFQCIVRPGPTYIIR